MAERIEQYLDEVGAQVRWKRVRPALKRELRTHLEEQTEAYLAEGMAEDAAEAEAVRQMGDAEAVGLALDAVHRPKKQTAILLFAGLAIVLGMYLRTEWIGSSLAFALASGVLACGALFGGYYLDYRRLSRYAWYIYGAVFVLGAICVYQTTFMGPGAPRMLGITVGDTSEYAALLYPAAYALAVYALGFALLAALKTDGVIYRQQEIAWNHLGKKSVTNNLTIPIVCRGQFVGSVQLSRDVTNMGRSGRTVQRAREESSAPAATGARYTLEDIVGQSPEIQEVRRLIQRIANSSSSVLVYGETGTGKELVVSSIHNASYRKDKTFMPINCAALPESILESLLFGTRRGAFTGAEDRVGLIEECSGGTIYLDEINSMPLKLQSKLLRVLDTKTVMALGASKPKEVDIRIVASVNRSPEQLMQNKEMLPDLFYRLNAIHIRVPPLRSRPGDIELLAQHFLDSYNRQLGKQNNGISPEAMELLKTYHWPGNVRELEHTIEAALNLTDGSRELRVEDIPAYFFSPAGASAAASGAANTRSVPNVPLREAVADYERGLIRQALQEAKGNIDRAAALLQIPRTTLYSRMSKLGLR